MDTAHALSIPYFFPNIFSIVNWYAFANNLSFKPQTENDAHSVSVQVSVLDDVSRTATVFMFVLILYIFVNF